MEVDGRIALERNEQSILECLCGETKSKLLELHIGIQLIQQGTVILWSFPKIKISSTLSEQKITPLLQQETFRKTNTS